MPTYDYRCQDCQHTFHQVERMMADRQTVCPECEGTIRTVIGTRATLLQKGPNPDDLVRDGIFSPKMIESMGKIAND